MKIKTVAIAALLFGCISCVEVNNRLGENLIPIDQLYDIYAESTPLTSVRMQMADSLSGFSNTRITIGAVRDDVYGLTTRASAISLVPLLDTMDFGENPVVQNFHFCAEIDTVSACFTNQTHILQNVNVYELSRPIDAKKDFNCNATLDHSTGIISRGTPVINGKDSLSFNFTKEYAQRYLTITQDDLSSIDKYLKKFPGIYIDTDEPIGKGGRINMFKLQLGFDASYHTLKGSMAKLTIRTKYKEWKERKDTTFYFYYSPLQIYDIDSLLSSTSGDLPQYALNLTGHSSKEMAGEATEKVLIEGGGGLKPVITAKSLKDAASALISAHGADPAKVVINKASIILPFEFPEDYRDMDRYPVMLSPTCRIKTDTTATFMGLTDASSKDENQGDIDRSNLRFAPDITYHMQEILKMDDEKIASGNYDIWLLIMANEIVKTESSQSQNDMSEYYQYLAYQNYYNSMYGGYGGYGGYGYGGYGYGGYGGYGGYNSYYSNYYSYMMMAQYAAGSGSSVQTTTQLDKDRYYYGYLNGPAAERAPMLELTYSIPKTSL